jgi:hypothetical protein
MGKQTQHKAKKRHKELDRMRKAKEKMERRQGTKDKAVETETDLPATSVTEGSNQ